MGGKGRQKYLKDADCKGTRAEAGFVAIGEGMGVVGRGMATDERERRDSCSLRKMLVREEWCIYTGSLMHRVSRTCWPTVQ